MSAEDNAQVWVRVVSSSALLCGFIAALGSLFITPLRQELAYVALGSILFLPLLRSFGVSVILRQEKKYLFSSIGCLVLVCLLVVRKAFF